MGTFAVVYPVSSISAIYYNSNKIVGVNDGAYSSYFYPTNLNSGDIINSTNVVFQYDTGYLNYGSCSLPGSNFCGGLDGYLGLHFNISGEPHYGWVRIQVAANSSSITIIDYAYNKTQTVSGFGDPITAGQTLGIGDNELSKIKIVALNKSIALFNLPQQTNYRLFSITGQSVLDGKITNNTYVIEANTLASGIYIIELKDNTSNAVIRKKIVL